ncbi:hypothetical protein KC909_05685 [Candidatus Dojkabacteria bacterium]|uniref:Uncharacterized protein n=1 Tax=Candidatus Dojkabacteria bacterium TaxID=2099670 RepID=A0A955L6J4_9BACT|nr:hypothetical protein [Candidatus Dojkabacteria bacterium]
MKILTKLQLSIVTVLNLLSIPLMFLFFVLFEFIIPDPYYPNDIESRINSLLPIAFGLAIIAELIFFYLVTKQTKIKYYVIILVIQLVILTPIVIYILQSAQYIGQVM